MIKKRDELRELNLLLDGILNNVPVYLYVKDPEDDFRYLYWNKAFAEHSKIPASRQSAARTLRSFRSVRMPKGFAGMIWN